MTVDAQAIGSRIKAAREALGMKQEELAQILGLGSRQIVSGLERGTREVKAAEAVSIARALKVDLASLLAESPDTPVVQWRARPVDGARRTESEFLRWCERDRRVLTLLEQRPSADRLPRHDFDLACSTHVDADRLAREVAASLDLGARPARVLAAAISSRFEITVWYLEVPSGCAACTRGSYGAAILVPRGDAPWRRTFDIAHELFHLLTWRDVSSAPPGETLPPADEHVEKLANAFAASLLLPGDTVLDELEERSVARRVKLVELVAMARDFGVSLETLVWRLHNLGCWPDQSAVRELLDSPRLRGIDKASQQGQWVEPARLPERFVQSAYAATLRGRLSRSQLATYFGCGLSELPAQLAEFGIDESLTELVSQDVSVGLQPGDLDAPVTSCAQE